MSINNTLLEIPHVYRDVFYRLANRTDTDNLELLNKFENVWVGDRTSRPA